MTVSKSTNFQTDAMSLSLCSFTGALFLYYQVNSGTGEWGVEEKFFREKIIKAFVSRDFYRAPVILEFFFV